METVNEDDEELNEGIKHKKILKLREAALDELEQKFLEFIEKKSYKLYTLEQSFK